nr:hypothetical protein [uncultured bacterium]
MGLMRWMCAPGSNSADMATELSVTRLRQVLESAKPWP